MSRVAKIRAKIEQHDKDVDVFYNDPITDHCGCVFDFAADFDNKKRKLCADLLKAAREEKNKEAEQEALDLLEQWMP